jgi:hypothetical protein
MRTIIYSTCFIILLLVNLPLQTSALASSAIINVKAFGAKGDGITDDYGALLNAISTLNRNGSGTLFFPKGNYLLNVHHTKGSELKDIIIENCKNVVVQGQDAIITLNGKFNRTADYKRKSYYYSYASAIIPLTFKNCYNVTVKNLEINGNVNLMRRDKHVAESGGHLIRFLSTSNVLMENVFVHHGQTDGIYINRKCKDFKFLNVRSTNNARQGMSIIELEKGVFNSCEFSFNGVTNGSYAGHLPKAGVDIEPTAATGQVVKDVSFFNCKFEGNAGAQFITSQPKTTSNIRIDKSIFDAKGSSSKYQLILSSRMLSIVNCSINLGNGDLYPLWKKFSGSSTRIEDSKITGSSKGIFAVTNDQSNEVILKNNRIIFTGKSLNTYFPYLQVRNLTFTKNRIEFPSSALKGKKVSSMIHNGLISADNVFLSDGLKIKSPASYKGTKIVKDK